MWSSALLEGPCELQVPVLLVFSERAGDWKTPDLLWASFCGSQSDACQYGDPLEAPRNPLLWDPMSECTQPFGGATVACAFVGFGRYLV